MKDLKCSLSGQAAADAKYYGNTEVYNILKARGAKAPVQYKHFLVFFMLDFMLVGRFIT